MGDGASSANRWARVGLHVRDNAVAVLRFEPSLHRPGVADSGEWRHHHRAHCRAGSYALDVSPNGHSCGHQNRTVTPPGCTSWSQPRGQPRFTTSPLADSLITSGTPALLRSRADRGSSADACSSRRTWIDKQLAHLRPVYPTGANRWVDREDLRGLYARSHSSCSNAATSCCRCPSEERGHGLGSLWDSRYLAHRRRRLHSAPIPQDYVLDGQRLVLGPSTAGL